jgi:hypothetical protein
VPRPPNGGAGTPAGAYLGGAGGDALRDAMRSEDMLIDGTVNCIWPFALVWDKIVGVEPSREPD